MDHDSIRGRLAAWMQRHDLSYRLVCFRMFLTFGYVVMTVQAAQKRGVLIGLVTVLAWLPILLTYWRRVPFSSTWLVRNKAAGTIHATIFSFAMACFVFPWSTTTCALVIFTLIGLTSILDLGWRRRRSRQAH
jgi:hypothetical protein